MTLAVLAEDFLAFCLCFHIALFEWQVEDFGEACCREAGRFVRPIGGISAPRGDGKTHGAAAVGLWRLVTGRPGTHIVGVALDRDGTRVLLDQARVMIRASPELQDAIEERANGLFVPATGNRWTIHSREHEDIRGLHPDVVLYDEAGWATDDELFSTLLAGQASTRDPLFLVVSTVGRRQSGPLWKIQQLAAAGDPSVCWRWHGRNRSPLVTPAFIERQRRILLPGQFAREHQNAWVDAADSFTSAAEVDEAMDHGWSLQIQGDKQHTYECFTDLGIVSDPSVIAVGHREGTQVYIDHIETFQGSREQPVQLTDIEASLRSLASRFAVKRMRIESWQGISAVQSLQRLGLPVELFSPTAKAHSEEWPVLAQHLAARTIVLPRHAQLRDELLNLVYEVGPRGVKVTDKGSIHQDHAVAVRGVVATLQMQTGHGGCIVKLLGW